MMNAGTKVLYIGHPDSLTLPVDKGTPGVVVMTPAYPVFANRPTWVKFDKCPSSQPVADSDILPLSGNPAFTTWTKEKLAEFKQAYFDARGNGETLFRYDDTPFFTGYAFYLIQYLETALS